MKHFIYTLLICCFSFSLSAQIAVGEWRTHFSYHNVTRVEYADGEVYGVANGKLFSYTPSDNVIEDYNALTGLNGNEIDFMAYNASAEALLLIYKDGNMDIISEEGIVNLSDFKDKSIAADKTVYALRMYGDDAYISTAMGVMVLDMKREEISETYILKTTVGKYTPVYDFAVLGDVYYMLTPVGLYKGNRSDNLLDSQYWTAMAFVDNEVPEAIMTRKSELYALSGKKIYRLQEGIWTLYLQFPTAVQAMEVRSDYLILNFPGTTEVRDPDDKVLVMEPKDHYAIAVNTEDNEFYGAAGKEGMIVWKYDATSDQYYIDNYNIVPNGPDVNTAWKMFFKDERLYVTGGGRWGNRYFYTGGIMQFSDNEWVSLADADSVGKQTGSLFQDILNMAVDPKNSKHIFATSWGEGLYEFTDGTLDSLYTWDNSPLVTAVKNDPYRYVRVDGATYDSQGNLWMLNSDPTYGKGGIHILKADGSWFSPEYDKFPGLAPSWDDILFKSDGQIWINSERATYGIFVLDNNGTLEDLSDDRTRWITSFTDQDGITPNVFTVHCIVEDKDGTLWIGTNVGPFLLYSTSTVFDQAPAFIRVKVPRNDGTKEADYLLTDARVYAIAVDGANRKWIGTNSDGAYLLSSDGLETIHHFTTANSPLPSNVVYSIAIHPETGEVFIGTEGGLVSYRSDATEGEASYTDVHAFPNPVRPGYTGTITITGLTENSQVKITDVSGHLMAAGSSLGGQYTWSGYNAAGDRAGSGVYLVFAADKNGEQGIVCKIIIVN